jgi:hypothetical protein
MSLLNRLTRLAGSLLRPPRSGSGVRRGRTADVTVPSAGVPGTTVEYTGALPPLEYEPAPDRHADPGEIVWAWVPYEENDGRGKDRPVLVIAHHPGGYLGLQTTSKDHDRDRADEAHWGRYWFDIGSGAWDRQGRESEVRLDRVLYLPESAVRREGAGLDKTRYDAVAGALLTLRRRPGH